MLQYMDTVLGFAIVMIFLGLGAPFWYNILSQLSTLRPLIAGKIEAKPGEWSTGPLE